MQNNLVLIFVSFITGLFVGKYAFTKKEHTSQLPNYAKSICEVMAKHAHNQSVKRPSSNFSKDNSPSANQENSLPEKQQSVFDQLSNLNYKDISTICKRAEDRWYKKNIEEKFVFPNTDKEKEEQKQKIYATFKDQLAESSWWYADSSATFNNQLVRMEFILYFYDANKFDDYEPKIESLKKVGDLCWLVVGNFTLNGNEHTSSTSACLAHIAKMEDQYYVQMRSYDVEIMELVNYFAIPVPIEKEQGPWMYLPNGSEEWQKENTLYWKTMTDAERKIQQEKFHLFKKENPED